MYSIRAEHAIAGRKCESGAYKIDKKTRDSANGPPEILPISGFPLYLGKHSPRAFMVQGFLMCLKSRDLYVSGQVAVPQVSSRAYIFTFATCKVR